MNQGSTVKHDGARKWMWRFLAALVAVQLYFVRELLAALFLFAAAFAVLAVVALVIVVAEQAGAWSFAKVEPGTRTAADLGRRMFSLLPFVKPTREAHEG